MKILFDDQVFSRVPYGGISKYFIELTKGLRKFGGTETALSCSYSFNEDLLDSGLYPSVKPFFNGRSFKGRPRLLSLINRFNSRKQLRKAGFDIFHPTYYNHYFLPYLQKKPFVVTCHDLIHEKFTHQYPALNKDISANTGKAEILKRSDRIIAVSENTKKDLLEYYKIDPAKITVIHLAHERSVFPSGQERPAGLPDQYLLFTGKRVAYKNFSLFLEAIVPLLLKNRDLAVVCAGGGIFTKEEGQLFHDLGVRGQLLHVSLNAANLDALYKNAFAFIYPSLYEGFGIPVLEALSNGCPTLLSNTSSLPEVAGDAALYFDSYQKESIYAACERIFTDSTLRLELREKGPARAALFTWEATASKTYNLYNEIV